MPSANQLPRDDPAAARTAERSEGERRPVTSICGTAALLWLPATVFADKLSVTTAAPGLMLQAYDAPSGTAPPTFMLRVNKPWGPLSATQIMTWEVANPALGAHIRRRFLGLALPSSSGGNSNYVRVYTAGEAA